MKDPFNLRFQEREQRRQALHNALRIIDSNQSSLGQANAELLRRLVLSTHISTEVNSMVNRHLGPEAVASSLLENNHRSRR